MLLFHFSLVYALQINKLYGIIIMCYIYIYIFKSNIVLMPHETQTVALVPKKDELGRHVAFNLSPQSA